MITRTSVLFLSMMFAVSANAAEYLVKYKDAGVFMSTMTASPNATGVKFLSHHEEGSLVRVEVSDVKAKMARQLASLQTNPAVEYVVPNAKVYALTAPFDAQALKEQWAVKKVNAEKAWQIAGNKGSRQVVVAVIDTGIDYNHKSLKENTVAGYDFAENDADPMDKTSAQNPGHGTHCAGIVGATGLSDDGTIGISPEVSMMPIRGLNEQGSGTLEGLIKAIDYAIEKKVDVISASWGAAIKRDQAKPLIEAVERADAAGIIFVAAAANDGKNNDVVDMFPANSGTPNMIAVAASGPSDAKPSWSNYGKATVDLASPGENIMSTLPKDKYGNLSGTSMATPLVSGLVALLKAQDRTLTGAQIRSLLQTTGAKVSIETACDCRVDAGEAMQTLKSQKMFVSPAARTLKVGGTQKFEGVYGKAPFSFASLNATVASIDAGTGELKALAKGDTTITVKDSTGATATSLAIRVMDGSQTPPPGECPLGDPAICELICQFQPDLPFCSGK
ncbi:MAG: S8 family serine peptidase [Pseudobdellovibrionaceae bacterium]